MGDERPEVAKGTAVCPSCGGKLIPIVYGLPGPEACDAAERGEIALGGCIVMGDDPQVQCASCNEHFWTRSTQR